MSQEPLVVPERHRRYYATVNYHRTDDLRQPSKKDGPAPVPENGSRVLVTAGWLMDEEEAFPGELAFLVDEPAGFSFWIPQRDLADFELCTSRYAPALPSN